MEKRSLYICIRNKIIAQLNYPDSTLQRLIIKLTQFQKNPKLIIFFCATLFFKYFSQVIRNCAASLTIIIIYELFINI